MTKLINELQTILTQDKQGNLYDFVCNNYYLLSKEELKDLCKEAFALLYEKAEKENQRNGREWDNYKKLHKEYLETLKDNTTLFDDEEDY